MNFGFVIDNRRCIGCHACSTACKSENQVPLGVHRTWVKTVEHGSFPDTRRSFQVTRCNHCDNPPCVRICPTTAMYQRADGIVEFDRRSCIGCKSCMQACPYDAIYIDPETATAAKCHFCSHRIDIGLEPACVVVCPVHAIIAGDLDDPESEISRTVAQNQTTVRKPDQGTAPKLLYINGSDISLHPTVFAEPPVAMTVTDVIEPRTGSVPPNGHAARAGRTARSGVPIRTPAEQGQPPNGPVQIGSGRFAEHMVQLNYNAQHKLPWHWPVPAYLVTKAIGAGAFLFLALGAILGAFGGSPVTAVWAGGVGLAFTMATTALLVADLERPKRFLYILLYPQWKSWLVRGAYLLIGFSAAASLWWLAELGELLKWWTVPTLAAEIAPWVVAPLAVGAAIYTAFLFAQAEGRDLWQSPLLPFQLVIQALAMGAGVVLCVALAVDIPTDVLQVARVAFLASLVVNLFVVLVGELTVPHASEVAARAAHAIVRGRYSTHFWLGGVVVGHVLPFVLVSVSSPIALAGAAVCAAAGLYAYEYAFVMAPQEVPNS